MPSITHVAVKSQMEQKQKAWLGDNFFHSGIFENFENFRNRFYYQLNDVPIPDNVKEQVFSGGNFSKFQN